MQCVSFDVFRTLGMPDTRVLKPEHFLKHKDELQQTDWVLFPEYWQLNALVYGLKCRIFPSLASYRIGHDKVEMTRAFQTVAAAHTPFTLIEANTPQAREMIWDTLALPFVAKRPRASMGDGVWLIETAADWRRYWEAAEVLYVQEYLPIEKDIRVVVVGGRVITAYWRHQAEQGFYNNIAKGGRVDYAEVPQAALDLALRVANDLDVNHAGFDIAMIGSHPYLLEFNRLFGNQGINQSGLLRDAILDYLLRYTPDHPDTPLRPLLTAV